jgi:C1A family cysteine protease
MYNINMFQKNKLKIFISLILLIIIASQESEVDDKKEFKKFMKFMKNHNKNYTTPDEFSERYNIFKENGKKKQKMKIEKDNSTDSDDEDDTNEFLDMTTQEFSKRFLSLDVKLSDMVDSAKPSNESWASTGGKRLLQVIPTSFDWRTKNAVSPVKNQGNCGSCYAFASMATLESQYLIKYAVLKKLSEQQIVDCDTSNSGCNGGIMANVYYYLMTKHGPDSSTDYPYISSTGATGTCKAASYAAQLKVTGYKFAGTTDENSIATWLSSYGPLAAALNAKLLQYYSSGVLLASNSCDPNALNHAVTLIGFGVTSGGTPYWIIKNSWGSSWGESGYFRIQKGKGMCGINKYVIAPTIA